MSEAGTIFVHDFGANGGQRFGSTWNKSAFSARLGQVSLSVQVCRAPDLRSGESLP